MKLIFKKSNYWFLIGICFTVPLEMLTHRKKNNLYKRYKLDENKTEKKNIPE